MYSDFIDLGSIYNEKETKPDYALLTQAEYDTLRSLRSELVSACLRFKFLNYERELSEEEENTKYTELYSSIQQYLKREGRYDEWDRISLDSNTSISDKVKFCFEVVKEDEYQKYFGNTMERKNAEIQFARLTAFNIKDVKQTVSDIEAAAAAYVVFNQSRNSAGESWTGSKYKSQLDYYRKINRLGDVIDRMEDVEVRNGVDAFEVLPEYLENERCMILL